MKKIIFTVMLCSVFIFSNKVFSMDKAEDNPRYEIKEIIDKDGRLLKDGVKMPAMSKEQQEEVREIKEKYRNKIEALKKQEMAEIRAVINKNKP